MLKRIDDFLNKITMYRLVLYILIGLLVAALGLSFFGYLSFTPAALFVSVLFIIFVSYIANIIWSVVFRAPTNVESVYITALILALIINPTTTPWDLAFFSFAVWASVWAMASKYLFAINKKHVFNPVAIAVVITSLALGQSASWWVGQGVMLPFVLVGGFLLIRKMKRADLMLGFFVVATTSIGGSALLHGSNVITALTRTFIDTPLFFFAFIMLTEPLTTPPSRTLRVLYGGFVGLLYAPWVHVGSLYFTPEIALVLGNVLSYAVSPKQKFIMNLKQRIKIAENTFDFLFTPEKQLNFKPGQYMELTLSHTSADTRGNRRYFTLASSPTERDLRFGIKLYPEGSSFKKAIMGMSPIDAIVASQIAGDFVLPSDPAQKLVFIAGGIGITPFRSMIKYLLDTKQKREVTLFYANKKYSDIAYADVFDEAQKQIGTKIVYVLSDKEAAPKAWRGRTGSIDSTMLTKEVPDYLERIFYISGPHGMVESFKKTLQEVGVPRNNIKIDYFPGFA